MSGGRHEDRRRETESPKLLTGRLTASFENRNGHGRLPFRRILRRGALTRSRLGEPVFHGSARGQSFGRLTSGMRRHDHVLIRDSRHGERFFTEREQGRSQRNPERFRGLHVGNGYARFRIGGVRSGIRSVSRPLLRSRRMWKYRSDARVFYRHVADDNVELALFRHPCAMHVRMRRRIFVGRFVMQGRLSDSGSRLLFRIVLRDIALVNASPWMNRQPHGNEFFRKFPE